MSRFDRTHNFCVIFCHFVIPFACIEHTHLIPFAFFFVYVRIYLWHSSEWSFVQLDLHAIYVGELPMLNTHQDLLCHRTNCENGTHSALLYIYGPMFMIAKTTATTRTTLPKRANHNTCWLGADIVSYLIIMIDWIWMWNILPVDSVGDDDYDNEDDDDHHHDEEFPTVHSTPSAL